MTAIQKKMIYPEGPTSDLIRRETDLTNIAYAADLILDRYLVTLDTETRLALAHLISVVTRNRS